MLQKMTAGFLILATSALFGMSLNQLNTASKAELMQINGIGEKKADAIIKERRKGKFKSFEDLQRVDGIGMQTAANVKHDVKSAADVKKVTQKTKTSQKHKVSKKDKKAEKKKKKMHKHEDKSKMKKSNAKTSKIKKETKKQTKSKKKH
ncbi:Periplasmic dsDNA and ssDNA-binding protein contributing to transformation [hydrothermal vent metagenome]|uniref:Periplasmic dsDNA and ssDNA-binding protein contributing to transformation n=1 Tax=hydrothermal vent metagenome TaxID=652676 RepID=A0A1W1C517_9ZZZZ